MSTRVVIMEKLKNRIVRSAVLYCMCRLLVPASIELYKSKMILNHGLEDQQTVSFMVNNKVRIQGTDEVVTEEDLTRDWYDKSEYGGVSYVNDTIRGFERRFLTANGMFPPYEFEFIFERLYPKYDIRGDATQWYAERIESLEREEMPRDFVGTDTATYMDLFGS